MSITESTHYTHTMMDTRGHADEGYLVLPDLTDDSFDAFFNGLGEGVVPTARGQGSDDTPVAHSFSDVFEDLMKEDAKAPLTPPQEATSPKIMSPWSSLVVPQQSKGLSQAEASSHAALVDMMKTFSAPITPPTSPAEEGYEGSDSGGESSTSTGSSPTSAFTGGAGQQHTCGKVRARVAQQPRKKWKCSKDFLLANITATERAQLIAKGIDTPPAGVAPTSVTKSQETVLRKALRRIRNVESAKRSRAAQKNQQLELEQTVTSVQEMNVGLLTANAALTKQNHTLLMQLQQLRASIGGDGAALFMVILCCGMSCSPRTSTFFQGDDVGVDTSVPTTTRAFRSRTLLMMEDEPEASYTNLLVPTVLCVVAVLLGAHVLRRLLGLDAHAEPAKKAS